jgi:hypothetical protein
MVGVWKTAIAAEWDNRCVFQFKFEGRNRQVSTAVERGYVVDGEGVIHAVVDDDAGGRDVQNLVGRGSLLLPAHHFRAKMLCCFDPYITFLDKDVDPGLSLRSVVRKEAAFY